MVSLVLTPILLILIIYKNNSISPIFFNIMFGLTFTTNVATMFLSTYVWIKTEQVADVIETIMSTIKKFSGNLEDFGVTMKALEPVFKTLKGFSDEDIEKVCRLINSSKGMLSSWKPPVKGKINK